MEIKKIVKLPHHNRTGPCTSRAPYRQGKKLTAVKVEREECVQIFNDESKHLLIRGVPALNLLREVKNLCLRYGEVKHIHTISNYAEDEEPFTEVFHVLYERIQSTRFAKHMIDNKSFFGGILHVCYAPELESITETRQKLLQRKYDILKRIKTPLTSFCDQVPEKELVLNTENFGAVESKRLNSLFSFNSIYVKFQSYNEPNTLSPLTTYTTDHLVGSSQSSCNVGTSGLNNRKTSVSLCDTSKLSKTNKNLSLALKRNTSHLLYEKFELTNKLLPSTSKRIKFNENKKN